jgi:alpha/beta superfamily hydrolase
MSELTGNTFFEGPAGRLEGILKDPAEETARGARAAVVCHPHPLYGGTMHNKVVYRIARAFQKKGFAVLRFNFRGVGLSAGSHDRGEGEQDDLIAAMDFMLERRPGSELWLAGFSFGASVVYRVGCKEARAHAMVEAGLPVSTFDFDAAPGCNKPKFFVQGAHDQFGTTEDLARFFERVAEPKRMAVIDGADHFFEGHLEQLEDVTLKFIEDNTAALT